MHVRVLGLPQQQGSKNPWGGETNKKLVPWRGHVTQTVGEAWGDAPALLGPVKVCVVFAFPRPASHYGTGRNAGVLKANAPEYKQSTPDLDKLQRAIGDALKEAGVYRDDSLIAVWEATKRYASKAYADISIIDLSGGHDDSGRSAHAGEGPSTGHADLGGSAGVCPPSS